MKTKLNPLSAVLALLLLAGCATTFRPWNMEKVDPGMTKAEVTEVLGKPNSTVAASDNVEYLYYEYTESSTAAVDANRDLDRSDRQFEKAMEKQGRKMTYRITLTDGKVTNYEQVK